MTDLKFDASGLIPAVVQDADTGRVLMLAYMNGESLKKTLETGETWFYSRSRQELWQKGATSGHIQKVRRIDYDCDGDALLVHVEQYGVACHTGNPTCFHRMLSGSEAEAAGNFLAELEKIIAERKKNRPDGSYTAKLFEKGIDRILKKVGEEAAEVIIAAKNEARNELIFEAGDLLYHLLVLLAQKEVALSEIMAELARRHCPRIANEPESGTA